MVDIYSIALCAIVSLFALMTGLSLLLIRDQSKLNARQDLLEHRTDTELKSFREQVKLFKRFSEQQPEEEEKG